jgi:hypothetical protein
VRKSACCANQTECAASKQGLGCGNPSSPEEIMHGFQQEVPSQEWVHMHGRPGYSCGPGDGCWPVEATLQKLLMAGKTSPLLLKAQYGSSFTVVCTHCGVVWLPGAPVARATHGHITVLAGCRQRGQGVTEYRVLDSLKDPATPLWMNYTLLTLGPPPGQGDGPWQDTCDLCQQPRSKRTQCTLCSHYNVDHYDAT